MEWLPKTKSFSFYKVVPKVVGLLLGHPSPTTPPTGKYQGPNRTNTQSPWSDNSNYRQSPCSNGSQVCRAAHPIPRPGDSVAEMRVSQQASRKSFAGIILRNISYSYMSIRTHVFHVYSWHSQRDVTRTSWAVCQEPGVWPAKEFVGCQSPETQNHRYRYVYGFDSRRRSQNRRGPCRYISWRSSGARSQNQYTQRRHISQTLVLQIAQRRSMPYGPKYGCLLTWSPRESTTAMAHPQHLPTKASYTQNAALTSSAQRGHLSCCQHL